MVWYVCMRRWYSRETVRPLEEAVGGAQKVVQRSPALLALLTLAEERLQVCNVYTHHKGGSEKAPTSAVHVWHSCSSACVTLVTGNAQLGRNLKLVGS